MARSSPLAPRITPRIFQADSSGTPIVLRGHEHDVKSIAFSPDGTRLATGSADYTVRVWNVDGTGAPLILKAHGDAVTAVVFSPDGTRLVTGSVDKSVRSFVVAPEALLKALWDATSDCVPISRRSELLIESQEEATRKHESCRQEIAKRQGWTVQKKN